MIKLSVNETKWSSSLARTRALIFYISIWIFDFGPEKLPGSSRNGPLENKITLTRVRNPGKGQRKRALISFGWLSRNFHALVCERPRINVKVRRGLTLSLRAFSRKFELQARSTTEKVVVEVPKQFHISWWILKDFLVTSSYGSLPQRFLWTLFGIQELSVEEQISLASL